MPCFRDFYAISACLVTQKTWILEYTMAHKTKYDMGQKVNNCLYNFCLWKLHKTNGTIEKVFPQNLFQLKKNTFLT